MSNRISSIPQFDIQPEKGLFGVHGRSYPENPDEEYRNLVVSIIDYCKSPLESTLFTVGLDVCSTSSVKVLVHLFQLLEDMVEEHNKLVKVVWKVVHDNEDDLHFAEDMRDSTDLPFEIVPAYN